MGLDVSPDLDALVCYVVVLAAGALAALFQLYDKLGSFRGAWVMVETWALYAVYTIFPVALFWLLDRTNAIHDTSLFAALIIGVGYQQILFRTTLIYQNPVGGHWFLAILQRLGRSDVRPDSNANSKRPTVGSRKLSYPRCWAASSALRRCGSWPW
jgi:hypothetical protein